MIGNSTLENCTYQAGRNAAHKQHRLAAHLCDVSDEEALGERRAHGATHQARHQLADSQPVLAAQAVQQRHRMELRSIVVFMLAA